MLRMVRTRVNQPNSRRLSDAATRGPEIRLPMRALRSLFPRGGRFPRTVLSDFTIQFVQRVEDLSEDLVTVRREAVQPRRLGTFRFRRAQPAAPGHSREDWIQRAWTQAIAMFLELLKHPLTVHPPFGGVVEDVDLPEGEQELADDRIARHRRMIALPVRSRYSITARSLAAVRSTLRGRISCLQSTFAISSTTSKRQSHFTRGTWGSRCFRVCFLRSQMSHVATCVYSSAVRRVPLDVRCPTVVGLRLAAGIVFT